MTFTNEPISQSEKDMASRLVASGIDYDLFARWNRGENKRSSKSEQLAREIADLDWLVGGDALSFRFGGDGDSGEFLIDLINLLFELHDSEGL